MLEALTCSRREDSLSCRHGVKPPHSHSLIFRCGCVLQAGRQPRQMTTTSGNWPCGHPKPHLLGAQLQLLPHPQSCVQPIPQHPRVCVGSYAVYTPRPGIYQCNRNKFILILRYSSFNLRSYQPRSRDKI